MIKEPKIINFEKVLEILDILGKYIDNDEIKPEFFEKPELITKCISIFSGEPIEEMTPENALDMTMDFDNYMKVNEILEANKIVNKFGLR